MNGPASFGDELVNIGRCCGAQNVLPGHLRARDAMTSGMTAFVVAIGGTSVIFYLLMNRAQKRSARRESTGSDGSSSSVSGDS